jgi:hypothetical protein
LGKIYFPSEVSIDRIDVRAVAVASQLENSFSLGFEVFHKHPRASSTTVADMVRNNQFGFAVECNPRPDASPTSTPQRECLN